MKSNVYYVLWSARPLIHGMHSIKISMFTLGLTFNLLSLYNLDSLLPELPDERSEK